MSPPPSSPPGRSRRRRPRLAPTAGALLLAPLLLACSWNDQAAPDCAGAPSPGVVSLWTDCEGLAAGGAARQVLLTNDSPEPVWTYHHCEGHVPWPAVLEDDGSWTSLLPAGFSLALGCHHVEKLEPGASLVFEPSAAGLDASRLHRWELIVGRDCGDLHDPHHLAAACASLELVAGAPFTLD